MTTDWPRKSVIVNFLACFRGPGTPLECGEPGPLASLPENKIVDGKLYLNYGKGVQKKWQQDVPGIIQKADRNWPDLQK